MSKSEPQRKESDVYDRQIRLWGAEAQAKMAQSKVLYIHITGVSSEILKNMVLAGIRAVICDDRIFESVAGTPNFFVQESDRDSTKKKAKVTLADVTKPKIEELNPLLGSCDIVSYKDLTDEKLAEFSIVVCSRMPNLKEPIRIAQAVTKSGGKFYMVDSFGLSGTAVLDLGNNYSFRPEMGKELLEATTLKEYVPLEQLLQVPLSDAVNRFHKTPPPQWLQYRCILEFVEQKEEWPTHDTAQDFCDCIQTWVKGTNAAENKLLQLQPLKDLAKIATAEIIPVCSVLGGILGNEIIKVISGKGEPANNTIFFDGLSGKLWKFMVKPRN